MKALTLILAFLCATSLAGVLDGPFEGTRATGMGNAFLGLADDANAIFYNPAGLARVKGPHLNVVDLTVGADSAQTLGRIDDAVRGNAGQLLQNATQLVNLAVQPSFVMPGFGFSVFDHARGFFDMSNLDNASARADIDSYNDLGAIVATALPLGDRASLGVSVRAFERSAVDGTVTASDVAQQIQANGGDIRGALLSALKQMAASGWGVGANVGFLYHVPLRGRSAPVWTLAATVEDIGGTSFHAINGENAPASIPQTYNFGTALSYTLGKATALNLALDMRDLFAGNPFRQEFHLGAELKYRALGVRAGVYDGYPTAGLSFWIAPHTELQASTYEVALGDTDSQPSARWYLLQLVIGLSPL